MRLDPIRPALADVRLRRRLAEANVEAAWLAGHGVAMPPGAGAALVGAFLSARTPEEAARAYAPARRATPADLAAMTELAQLVDVDLARAVAARCLKLGYGGPLQGPCVVAAAFPGRPPVTVLAFPHRLLTPKGAFAAVEIAGGCVLSDPDGAPCWSPMPWHWIVRLHPERPVPRLDAGDMVRRIEDAMETPPDEVSDALLAGVLAALASAGGARVRP